MSSAHHSLFAEMLTALEEDPARQIRTPGLAPALVTMQAHVAAFVHAKDAALLDLLRIASAACAPDANPTVLRLQAQAWIAQCAKDHADRHAPALARSQQALAQAQQAQAQAQ
jgi:hypothetical protein